MNEFLLNIGPAAAGIGELLVAITAGIGFLVRSRRSAKRQKALTTTAAQTAASEVEKNLRAELDKAHAQDLADKDQRIKELQAQVEGLMNALLKGQQHD